LRGAPGAPDQVEAVVISTRFVALSWSAPDDDDGVDGYSVYYKQAGSER